MSLTDDDLRTIRDKCKSVTLGDNLFWDAVVVIGRLATELLAARKALAERPALRVEDAFWLNSGAGFTDSDNRSVQALDVVEYGDRHANSWTPRRGIILDATGDGDAWVLFRDTKKVEIVKWMNLCKVPAIDEGRPSPPVKETPDAS